MRIDKINKIFLRLTSNSLLDTFMTKKFYQI